MFLNPLYVPQKWKSDSRTSGEKIRCFGSVLNDKKKKKTAEAKFKSKTLRIIPCDIWSFLDCVKYPFRPTDHIFAYANHGFAPLVDYVGTTLI